MAEKKDVDMEKPTDIAVVRFAAARAKEISTLNDIIENPTSTKLIFQKLPCHMRRRAMSHNPNRLPRALREAHKAQMGKSKVGNGKNDKGKVGVPKRPRRKYRRRPSRLLEEYTRRSGKTRWLKTHLWHAKRFHMTTKWGYRLPAQSCDRSFRFCYRSTAHYCLLMDVSYLCCIEISGPQSQILDGLKHLTNSNTGLTFGAASVLKGNFEGRCMMHHKDQYPHSPIGLVTFTWRYGDVNLDERTLWLSIHPAVFQETLSELQLVFQLDSELTNHESGIKLITHCDRLNRFRLRGPLSYQVLGALLDHDSRPKVAQLPPGFVMGANIRDPRITLPPKRCQPSTEFNSLTSFAPMQVIDVEVSRSCMWDSAEVDRVNNLRKVIPDRVINERRQKLLVPGTELPREADECAIPLLIINASHEGERYVPGCDLIIPSEWSTAVWLSLVYNGARAGGLFDGERMHFEYGSCRDLHLKIDTAAGKAAALERKLELMEAYFRKPPKNRTNYIKSATPYPFGVDWDRLVTEWSDGDAFRPFYVLRDRRILRSITPGNPIPEVLQNEPCLVFVTLSVIGQGCPHEFAMICLPREQDNPKATEAIVEPIHSDPAAKQRKLLRQEHQNELKSLARKRKAETDNEKKEELDSVAINDTFRKNMRALWLPVPCDLKTAFQRSVIGFVCQGDFGLSNGRGMAKGYIVARSLLFMKAKNVLLRNPGQDHYMWAEMTVG